MESIVRNYDDLPYEILDGKIVEVYLQENGVLQLNNIYSIYPDYVLNKMTEEEKEKIIKEFKTCTFDDLIISLEDVFYRIGE